MSWELKPARETFPTFTAEWDRLNAELYDCHPMFDSRFISQLLECFGKGNELLCSHRAATGQIDGALILRPLGFGRWALFLPAQAQAGPLMLRDACLLESLFAALPGNTWSIDLLAIDPDFAPDWTGLPLPRKITPHVLTMAVSVAGNFDNYWQSRPRNLVKNLRRYERRAIEQFGQPVTIVHREAGQMAAAIDRYGALESAGWKGKAGTAISSDNSQGRFYRDTLEAFAATGQAKVIELRIGDRLAASRLIIRNRQMWVILKTAYDETLATMAPGRQLLQEVLHRAFDRMHTGKVEFYTNANRDQAEWATSLRYITHHQIFRNKAFIALRGIAWFLASKPISWRGSPDGATQEAFTPLSIHKYTSTSEVPAATAQLFEETARVNVEFSPDWFRNLQETVFPDDRSLSYYVSEMNGQPTAILPIRLTANGPARQIESLGNYYTSLYSPLLAAKADASDLAPLLNAASRDAGTAHVMRFSPMDPDSPAYAGLLAALWSAGWVPFRYFCFGNWFLKVTDSWSSYLGKREGKHRSTIKRMKKKFDADGGKLEIVTDLAAVDKAIKAFNDVYALSWKKPEPYPGFIPGLIRWLADKKQLRLCIAWLHAQPVAAQLWTVCHGKAHIFKVAYDEKYSSYSPGTLVTAHLMEHVIDQDGIQEVDFLIGDDKYKQTWMSHRRERWGIIAYNPRTLWGLVLLIREIAGRAVRRLWQTQRLPEKQ